MGIKWLEFACRITGQSPKMMLVNFYLVGTLLLVAAGIMIVNIAPKKKDKAGENIKPSA
jgi:hypothetical protein